jgi:hypothetical protein
LKKKLKKRLKRTVQQLAVKCGVPTPEIEFWPYLPDLENIGAQRDGEYDVEADIIRLSLSSPYPRSTAIHEFIHYYLEWKLPRHRITEGDVEELTESIMQQPAEANVILSSFVRARGRRSLLLNF